MAVRYKGDIPEKSAADRRNVQLYIHIGQNDRILFRIFQRRLFDKTAVDKGTQTFEGFLFVRAVRDQRDRHALDNAEGENAEQTFRVDSAVVFFYPDRAFVGIGLLNEERSRSCVQTHVVLDGYVTRNHLLRS